MLGKSKKTIISNSSVVLSSTAIELPQQWTALSNGFHRLRLKSVKPPHMCVCVCYHECTRNTNCVRRNGENEMLEVREIFPNGINYCTSDHCIRNNVHRFQFDARRKDCYEIFLQLQKKKGECFSMRGIAIEVRGHLPPECSVLGGLILEGFEDWRLAHSLQGFWNPLCHIRSLRRE